MRAGVAISPDTPSTAITDEIGAAADMLLVMTVYPGSSAFSPKSLSESTNFSVRPCSLQYDILYL
jgi:pentose-5-phosphate-3-epimerase